MRYFISLGLINSISMISAASESPLTICIYSSHVIIILLSCLMPIVKNYYQLIGRTITALSPLFYSFSRCRHSFAHSNSDSCHV